MAITVVNSTPAQGLEFTICGYVDGSANPPMWSGSLNPSGQPDSSNVIDVSGFVTYGVSFFPVGWVQDGAAFAASPQVTDKTTVVLAINKT